MTEKDSEVLFRELQDAFRKMKHTRDMDPLPEGTGPGLTPGESHLLHAIIKLTHDGSKLRPADLADIRHMSPQALSPMLRKLEEAGLISRRVSNTDRRVSYIEPTGKGRKLDTHIGSFFDSQMRGLVAYLGEDDVRKLIEILAKAGDYMEIQSGEGRGLCMHGHNAPIMEHTTDGEEETN